MTKLEAFHAEVGDIASALAAGSRSHAELNLAAARIDHLGRQLHGIGFVRESEIAKWLSAAVEGLLASHHLSAELAAAAVIEAASKMYLARTAIGEGVRPVGP